jgi:alpha-amylase/alpha-mannosidase (GH57 family)
MHQPDYQVSPNDDYQQPWTYLHTIKDYVDMAMHLESVPEAKAVINFTPVLLDQIDDYAKQLSNYIDNNDAVIRDPLLAALADPTNHENGNSRVDLIDWCMRAHKERVIDRYPAYKMLVEINNQLHDNKYGHQYLSDQYVADLLVWYHLGWIAELVKKTDIRIKRLIKKAHYFDSNDRTELIAVIAELLCSVIPRYQALAKAGQIELTTTPYAHPIVPLLLDFDSASEAVPGIQKPKTKNYPGGLERANWHIQKGIEKFVHHFNFAPSGCWPSEGSLSTHTCKLLQDHGFEWTASGMNVFRNSVNSHTDSKLKLSEHKANQLDGQKLTCFFRDDELSDLIGFEYSSWHADDAVANLVHRLLAVGERTTNKQDSVISIILDGENAWEHYPENGYYFLSALYKKLSAHPKINLTTYSEFLGSSTSRQSLPNLVAGSWVYGTFTTWIGCKEKNLAWDMLCEAKVVFDEKIASNDLSEKEVTDATFQLAKCEGSDWFWWFGDYNPSISVSSFEILFRDNLIYLYKILHANPPDYLYTSFTSGSSSSTEEGTMRRSDISS